MTPEQEESCRQSASVREQECCSKALSRARSTFRKLPADFAATRRFFRNFRGGEGHDADAGSCRRRLSGYRIPRRARSLHASWRHAPAFHATGLPDVLAGLGSSLHLPLKSFLPRCSATIAVIPITPITRKIAKKTIAITRTGILHL